MNNEQPQIFVIEAVGQQEINDALARVFNEGMTLADKETRYDETRGAWVYSITYWRKPEPKAAEKPVQTISAAAIADANAKTKN